MERTMVLIKPDAVQRGLSGEIIHRLEQRGLKLCALKLLWVTKELAQKHYEVHKGKPFYEGLVDYITSSPLIALVIEGPGAVKAVRQTAGSTYPLESAPGSIRHDFGLTMGRNLIHASDSVENAEIEINLWFKREEIITWDRDVDQWVFKNN